MKNREVPKGLRDMLPDEVKVKRHIENKAARLFRSYGYQEVITPTFEFLEVIESGAGKNIRGELFLFMDREGGILSLRPEVTVSIARLASTHLKEAQFPQRLFYISNVFRHVQPHLAHYREYWQAGLELLGAPGPWADAEIINIAVRLLRSLDLTGFKISINQIGICNALLDDNTLSSAAKELIRTLVESKDLVELNRVLNDLPVEDGLKEAIASLPVLHGGLEVFKHIPYLEKNRPASMAVEELLQVHDALGKYGVLDDIVIDLGVLRRLDYYTGLVFEGYSPDLGYGLLGGGRYDRLMEQFGLPCPATGFAVGIDRLALVLKCRESEPHHYLVGGADPKRVLARCEELRKAGFVAEMDVLGRSPQALAAVVMDRENWSLEYLHD
ncbi:MAG: ATP phosphoribosyltransferase regulatory subunit [Syntrophomonadaceae bacterium]|jgi:ATP phosphoribosyltransferase regulatory subunit